MHAHFVADTPSQIFLSFLFNLLHFSLAAFQLRLFQFVQFAEGLLMADLVFSTLLLSLLDFEVTIRCVVVQTLVHGLLPFEFLVKHVFDLLLLVFNVSVLLGEN